MGSHLWGWILPAGWSRLVSVINESTDGSEKAKVITERTKKGFYAISPFPSWLLWNIPQASQEAMKFFPAGVVVPLFNNHTLVKNPPVAVALFPIPPYSYPNCLTHHPHHPPHKKKTYPHPYSPPSSIPSQSSKHHPQIHTKKPEDVLTNIIWSPHPQIPKQSESWIGIAGSPCSRDMITTPVS